MARPASQLQPGAAFGQLTVIKRATNACGKSAWVCRCVCGNELTVRRDNLVGGYQISCGCIRTGKRRWPTRRYDADLASLHPDDRPAGPKKFSEAASLDLARALGVLR